MKLVLIGLLLFPSVAFAADLPITGLPAASALGGTELTACVQSATTRKCTVNQVTDRSFSMFSQDCTATSAGVLTCTKTNNVAFGTLATASTPLSIANGGTGTATPALVEGSGITITGSWPNSTIAREPAVSYDTGNYYLQYGRTPAIGGFVGANIIRCYVGSVEQKLTTTNAGINVTTVAASGNVQMAIYKDSGGKPGDLIVATGSMSTTTLGTVTAAWTAAKQIGPDSTDGARFLWWCSNADTTAGNTAVLTITEITPSAGGYLMGGAIGEVFAGGTATPTRIACAGANCNGGSSTFNTWPSSLAGSTWSTATAAGAPLIAFDVTSIP